MADTLGIKVSELFTAPVLPITVLEKVQDTIIANIEKVIDETMQKAIAKRYKPVAGKERQNKRKK
jgi:hypothetical protein